MPILILFLNQEKGRGNFQLTSTMKFHKFDLLLNRRQGH